MRGVLIVIYNLLTDGFLYKFDEIGQSMSFGMINRGGGIRDIFREGEITMGDVVSVMPFENNLMEVSIPGNELEEIFSSSIGSMVFSGIRQAGNEVEIIKDGAWELLDQNSAYTGLMIVGYQDKYDAIDTGIHYRDAVIDYFRSIDDLADYTANRYPRLETVVTTTTLSDTATTLLNETTTTSTADEATSSTSTSDQREPTSSSSTSEIVPPPAVAFLPGLTGVAALVALIPMIIVRYLKRKVES